VTGLRQVDPGNVVHPSDASGIVVITQLDPIGVVFTLPQDELPRVSKQLAAGPVDVEAWSRDGLTRLAAGKLKLVDNEVNTQTATIKLKAVFPNPDRALWPNAFVKARLLLATRKAAVVVPATVVQRGPQGTFCYVIGEGNTVTMRPIDVELTQGEWTIVAKGVSPGDRVVVDGQSQLRPGAKVAPKPQEAGVSPSASIAPPGAPATPSSGAAGSAGAPGGAPRAGGAGGAR
jgi:multidrug efflux system membrane fusion protein